MTMLAKWLVLKDQLTSWDYRSLLREQSPRWANKT